MHLHNDEGEKKGARGEGPQPYQTNIVRLNIGFVSNPVRLNIGFVINPVRLNIGFVINP